MVKPSTLQRSPLSPTLWPPDAFVWHRSLVFLLGLLGAFLAGALLARGVILGSGEPAQHGALTLTWGIATAQIVTYAPLIVLVFTLLPWVAQRSMKDLGLKPFTLRALGIAVAGAVVMDIVAGAAAGIESLITHSPTVEEAVSLFTSTKNHALLAVFALIATVAAPFVEECLFRGFLFNALLRYMPLWASAVLSGLVFGAIHASWSAFVPLGCTGIVLAYVYYYSGSLTASIVTHALFNALNLLLLANGRT